MDPFRNPERTRIQMDRVLQALRSDQPRRAARTRSGTVAGLDPVEAKLAQIAGLAQTTSEAALRLKNEHRGSSSGAILESLQVESDTLRAVCLSWATSRDRHELISDLVRESRRDSRHTLTMCLGRDLAGGQDGAGGHEGSEGRNGGLAAADVLEFLTMSQAEIIGYLSAVSTMLDPSDSDLGRTVEASLATFRSNLRELLAAKDRSGGVR